MRDQFGRDITYMRVSVTDRCNLRCVYCMPEEGVPCVSHQEILRFDEIARICRIGAELGITRIKLTGGEPLVRRGLAELTGMLKAIPGIEQVTLTTNGTLLKGQIRELVSRGIDAVNISIDTLDPQRYRQITRCGCLQDALEGLDAACACPEIEVRVNCVPLTNVEYGAGAEEEYIRLALLAKERRIDVRFIEMMPIGMGKEFAGRTGADILKILERQFGRAEKVEGTVGNGPASYVRFAGMKGRIGLIRAVTHQFCDRCNRIRLTSEGRLKPCLQYGTGTDLRAVLRKGTGDEEMDEQLREAMRLAVYEKPARHCFGQETANAGGNAGALELKEMSQIGG